MRRRIFSRESMLSAVNLLRQQGYTDVQAAKNPGIGRASLRGWCKQFSLDEGDDAAQQPRGTGALQAELRQLREENKRLTMGTRYLRKSTAFFAKESQ
jgi:transposase-like protein